MLGKTQETSFEWQAMEAQENVGTKVGSLVLMANKNWGFDNGLKAGWNED